MTPKISIVIGTFNRPHVIQKLLKQLSEIPKPISMEVLVFDQSDKKNQEILKTLFPKKPNFKLYCLNKPNTCLYMNLGWKKANAGIVLYLDDDVEITYKTISGHIEAYNHSNINGVAGRVINDNEIVNENAKEVGKIKWFGSVFSKNFSSLNKSYVDFPYGCNMSFRKKILNEIGGFDEKLKGPIYSFNEIDLSCRIIKKYPNSLLFQPDALVYHKRYPTGGTRQYDKKTLLLNISFNYGYFLAKNYNVLENLIFLVRRLPYQILKERGDIINIFRGFAYGKCLHKKSKG